MAPVWIRCRCDIRASPGLLEYQKARGDDSLSPVMMKLARGSS